VANDALLAAIDMCGDRGIISWQIEDSSSSAMIDPRGRNAADVAGVLSDPGGRFDIERLREAIGV